MSDLRVLCFSEVKEIRRLISSWNSLLTKSKCNRAFSSPSWYLTFVDVFRAKPLVWAAHRGDQLVALLPLLDTTNETGSRLLVLGHILADYQDIIVAEGDEEAGPALVREVLGALLSKEALLLSKFRSDSCLFESLRTIEDDLNVLEPLSIAGICPYVSLDQNWENYLASRSHNFRKSLRRHERQAEREGFSLSICDHQEDDSVSAATEDFFRLHFARWDHKRRSSLFADTTHQKFFRQLIPMLVEEGNARIRVLSNVNSQEVACMHIEILDRISLASWQSGISMQYDYLSPGTILDAHAIRNARAEHFQEYDFLIGLEAYKQRWMTGQRKVYSLLLGPLT